MNQAMPPHTGNCRGQLPPLALLQPLVDRSEEATRGVDAHHYWDGPDADFAEEIDFRYAIYKWTPPRELVGGVYVVARVLWAYANPDVDSKGRMFRNTCGLPTCVNPAHFHCVIPATRSARRSDTSWVLSPGFKLHGNSVWVIQSNAGRASSILLTHLAVESPRYAVCGRAMKKGSVRGEGTLITCKACLQVWFAAGRSLVEVK